MLEGVLNFESEHFCQLPQLASRQDLWPSETFFEARCAPLHQLLMEGMSQLLDAGELQE